MSEIKKLEAERNLFKGKYRALLKLVRKTRDKLVHVTDHIEDEGDRQYFGSTNDADALRDLYDEMMSWVWDAVDETNRMKSDPYADIRKQRARAEKAEADLEAHKALIAERDARIAELEAALKPFRFEHCRIDLSRIDDDNQAWVAIDGAGSARLSFFVRDILKARAALNASEREGA